MSYSSLKPPIGNPGPFDESPRSGSELVSSAGGRKHAVGAKFPNPLFDSYPKPIFDSDYKVRFGMLQCSHLY